MDRGKRLSGLLALLLAAASCPSCCTLVLPHLEQPYSNPPATFHHSDLVGTWEASYGVGLDRLILRADETFRQIYQDWTVAGYVYETPWNEWWVEHLPDGRARLHLQGARYYLAGIRVAELDGMGAPCPKDYPDCGWDREPRSFYDPVAQEQLQMAGELVLNVRVDSSGEIILLHMWTDFERGFAIIGGQAEEFRRIETSLSPLQTMERVKNE